MLSLITAILILVLLLIVMATGAGIVGHLTKSPRKGFGTFIWIGLSMIAALIGAATGFALHYFLQPELPVYLAILIGSGAGLLLAIPFSWIVIKLIFWLEKLLNQRLSNY